ncbi:MAG: VWA domain-containing protein [Myxococcales bacterium]|nr:VWA domain-containing protein [Myxococcales bacterium]
MTSWLRPRKWLLCVLCLHLLSACKVNAGEGGLSGLGNVDDLQAEAERIAQEAGDLEICDGQTLEQLLEADALSDECRQQLLSFLPESQSTFEGRLIAPGGVRVAADGSLQVLLQGADASGLSLDADALLSAEVTLVTQGGEVVLQPGDYQWGFEADLDSELMSIAVVNDYSASMTDADLRDVAELQGEIFMCLPSVHETEVSRFSEMVSTVLPFASDDQAVAVALELDEGFERGTTALFDAVGSAAEALDARSRPVKMLLLSSDGRENASQTFEQADVLAALDDAGIFVVVFGALLADVDQLKTLAGDRGVFFYTREFKSLFDATSALREALKGLGELRIGADAIAGASVEAVRIRLDAELALELQVTAP